MPDPVGTSRSRPALEYLSLGQGQRVPYPTPSSPLASKVGQGNRRTNTKPEQILRSMLHRAGFRFRKDLRVGTPNGAVRVDIAFTRVRLAVFVDGCFWHSCPEHGSSPKSNQAYWGPKLSRNVERDRRNDLDLELAGWTVLRIWEHENVASAASRVTASYRELA